MKNDPGLVTGHHLPQSLGLSAFHAGMALPNINASLGMMQHNGHPLMMPRGGQMGAPGPPPIRPQISPNPLMTTPVHQPSQPSSGRQNVVQETGPSPPQKSSEPKEPEGMDSPSARGVFGWTAIEDISIPYLMRDDKKFVAVRMVEMKLLSKFPSTYPEELQNKPPLMSHYITSKEAKLLNEINADHCAMEFGRTNFNGRDLIVKLEDFIEFYRVVRKHFPDCSAKKSTKPKPPAPVDGGWIQVNNTVVPFVLRGVIRYVPLSVIRYAAGLLSEVPVEGHLPNPEECTYLNENCKKAGLTFTFAKSTKLIPTEVLTMKCDVPVQIQDLPKDDPFSFAEIKITPDEEMSQTPVTASSVGQPFPVMSQGLPATQVPSTMHGSMPRQNLPPTSSQFWMNPHMGIYPTQGPNIPQQYNRPPQPFMNQSLPMMNNGQSEQLRNYLSQSSRNVSPASRPEVNNNGSMKTGQNVPSLAESRPLSAGPRSSTPGEHVPAVPGQRRLSGSSVPNSRGSTPPQVANRMTPIGPPGWHPAMGSPEEYQRMLHMLAGQQNASASRQSQINAVPVTRAAPLAQLARMGPSLNQPNSNAAVSSVIRGPSKGSKRSPTVTPPLSRSSSADSLSASKTGNNSSQPSKSSHREGKIKPVEFYGKTLSCLIKGPSKDSYALVEAVARVYFPFCTLDEFQFALETILKLPVTVLSTEEEKSFIDFYGLPTKTLMCNKVVKLNEFELLMPKLTEIFKDKADAYAKRVARKRERESKSTSDKKSKDSTVQGTSERSASVDNDGGKSGQAALNLFKEKAKTVLKEIMGSKRAGSEEDGSQPPAKSRKRLEAAVLKLRQQQLSQDDSSGVDSPSPQNQDDSSQISDSVTKDTSEGLQDMESVEPHVLNIVPVDESTLSVAVAADIEQNEAINMSDKEVAPAIFNSSEDTTITMSDTQPDRDAQDSSETTDVAQGVIDVQPREISGDSSESKPEEVNLDENAPGNVDSVGSAEESSSAEYDRVPGPTLSLPVNVEPTNTTATIDTEKVDTERIVESDVSASYQPDDQAEALSDPEGMRGYDNINESCDLLADIGNISVPEPSPSVTENKTDVETSSEMEVDSEQPETSNLVAEIEHEVEQPRFVEHLNDDPSCQMQEGSKSDNVVPQEDQRSEKSVSQEDNRSVTSVTQEVNRSENSVPQEDNKSENSVPQEESRSETSMPQEDNRNETSMPQEDNRNETSMSQEDNRSEYAVQQEGSRSETVVPQENNECEKSLPQEDNSENSVSQEDITSENSASLEDSKSETPVPQEDNRNEASVLQEENASQISVSQEDNSDNSVLEKLLMDEAIPATDTNSTVPENEVDKTESPTALPPAEPSCPVDAEAESDMAARSEQVCDKPADVNQQVVDFPCQSVPKPPAPTENEGVSMPISANQESATEAIESPVVSEPVNVPTEDVDDVPMTDDPVIPDTYGTAAETPAVHEDKTESEVPPVVTRDNEMDNEVPPTVPVDDKVDSEILPTVPEESKVDTDIPQEVSEDDKMDTEVPPTVPKDDKVDTGTQQTVSEDDKMGTEIPPTVLEDNKVETDVPQAVSEDDKMDTEVPPAVPEDDKVHTDTQQTVSEDDKMDTEIPTTVLEDNKVDTDVPQAVSEDKMDTEVPPMVPEVSKVDTDLSKMVSEDDKLDTVIPPTLLEDNKMDSEIPASAVTDGPVSSEMKDSDQLVMKTDSQQPESMVQDNIEQSGAKETVETVTETEQQYDANITSDNTKPSHDNAEVEQLIDAPAASDKVNQSVEADDEFFGELTLEESDSEESEKASSMVVPSLPIDIPETVSSVPDAQIKNAVSEDQPTEKVVKSDETSLQGESDTATEQVSAESSVKPSVTDKSTEQTTVPCDTPVQEPEEKGVEQEVVPAPASDSQQSDADAGECPSDGAKKDSKDSESVEVPENQAENLEEPQQHLEQGCSYIN